MGIMRSLPRMLVLLLGLLAVRLVDHEGKQGCPRRDVTKIRLVRPLSLVQEGIGTWLRGNSTRVGTGAWSRGVRGEGVSGSRIRSGMGEAVAAACGLLMVTSRRKASVAVGDTARGAVCEGGSGQGW